MAWFEACAPKFTQAGTLTGVQDDNISLWLRFTVGFDGRLWNSANFRGVEARITHRIDNFRTGILASTWSYQRIYPTPIVATTYDLYWVQASQGGVNSPGIYLYRPSIEVKTTRFENELSEPTVDLGFAVAEEHYFGKSGIYSFS